MTILWDNEPGAADRYHFALGAVQVLGSAALVHRALDEDAHADLVVLVKPQFEVGRGRLNNQGVVTSDRDRAQALLAVVDAVGDHGLHVHGIRPSPISGTTGNAEYLLWARSDPSDTMSQDRVRALAREITSDTTGGRR